MELGLASTDEERTLPVSEREKMDRGKGRDRERERERERQRNGMVTGDRVGAGGRSMAPCMG